jgi:CheY-like chemotaxis protein
MQNNQNLLDDNSKIGQSKLKSKPQVLFVDDDPDHLLMYSLLMEKTGYTTILANNATEAMSVLEEKEIDLVVSDYRMPGVNGLELVSFIRKNGSNPTVPVIMLTASPEKIEDKFLDDYGPDLICNKDQASKMLGKQIGFLL